MSSFHPDIIVNQVGREGIREERLCGIYTHHSKFILGNSWVKSDIGELSKTLSSSNVYILCRLYPKFKILKGR